MNSIITAVGSIIIAFVLLIIGIAILFHKPIKKFFVFIIAKIKALKEKRTKQRQEEALVKQEQAAKEPQFNYFWCENGELKPITDAVFKQKLGDDLCGMLSSQHL